MWKLKKKNDAEQAEKKPKRKRKGRKWATPLVLLVIAAIGGGVFLQYRAGQTSATSAMAEGQRTATVTRGNLESKLTSSGTISPKDTYSITSLVEGEIILADFEEGDQVEKDQVLYQIDVSSMESEVKSANNTLERANSSYQQALDDYNEAVAKYSGNTYKSTRSGFISELKIESGDKVSSNTELATIYNDQVMKVKAPFLSGEAALIGAGNQAVITLADTEEQLSGVVTAVSNMDEVLDGGRLVRYVTLEVANPGGLTTSHTGTVQIGEFISVVEGTFEPMTDTVMNAEVASSVEVEAVLVHEGDFVTAGTPIFRIKSKDVENIIRTYKNSLDSAEEKIESAQSKIDSTQDTYENYTITAPISGQVITKSLKVGDNISKSSGSSSTTMAVIYNLSEVTFEMSIDELDVGNVKVGQTVEITADAIEGTNFTGKVTNISLESSQSNGVTNYPVTVTLDEVGGLLPGMNVDGVIILDSVEDVLMVPVDSLMRGNRVYVKDDTVTEQQGAVPVGFRAVEVETGLTNDSYIEIVSGLSEGDIIYVNESSQTTNIWMGGQGGMGGRGDMGGQGGMSGPVGGVRIGG